MVISQGEIWWADLPLPKGSGPGFRRPVVVVQSDSLNRSSIATVICVPLTSNLKWALAPGNVHLSARLTGLPKNSVANVSQIVTVDKDLLTERVGRLSRAETGIALGWNRHRPGQVISIVRESPKSHRNFAVLPAKWFAAALAVGYALASGLGAPNEERRGRLLAGAATAWSSTVCGSAKKTKTRRLLLSRAHQSPLLIRLLSAPPRPAEPMRSESFAQP